jgi:uncharacterized membrane protein YphA (DoxX/SURF4 family)
MGTLDRSVRVIVALAVGILLLTGTLTGTAAWILGILAVVFLLTSAASTCPLYIPFKISTRNNDAVQ